MKKMKTSHLAPLLSSSTYKINFDLFALIFVLYTIFCIFMAALDARLRQEGMTGTQCNQPSASPHFLPYVQLFVFCISNFVFHIKNLFCISCFVSSWGWKRWQVHIATNPLPPRMSFLALLIFSVGQYCISIKHFIVFNLCLNVIIFQPWTALIPHQCET